MKEKVLKYIIELVFIFIIPLALLATCFKQEKVYDENNNEVGKYLTFDNIFVLSDETITYYNYEYYDSNELIEFEVNEPIYINYNISPWLIFNSTGANNPFISRIFYQSFNDNIIRSLAEDSSIISVPNSISLSFSETNVIFIRSDFKMYVSNSRNNIIKNINTYTISDNVVSRLLNSLYDTLGITNNWILQFIVVYTLLWLIMWFIWHILYLPLDFICSKLLFDRVDK